MISNEHMPTYNNRKRVKDLVAVGISHESIARLLEIAPATLSKHYAKELANSLDETIERIGAKAIAMAEEGNDKMISFFLKTKGASRGWQEKQVVEQINNKDTAELLDRIAALEQQHNKDY